MLPTVVLGDPLQAIFGFGADNLADWNDVLKYFPLAGELSTPWRWINAGNKPLGRWLLEVRDKLLRGEAIDLRKAPAGVSWVELDGRDDHAKRIAAGRTRVTGADPCMLIIGDSTSPASQTSVRKRDSGGRDCRSCGIARPPAPPVCPPTAMARTRRAKSAAPRFVITVSANPACKIYQQLAR
jgi:hypothetical protein